MKVQRKGELHLRVSCLSAVNSSLQLNTFQCANCCLFMAFFPGSESIYFCMISRLIGGVSIMNYEVCHAVIILIASGHRKNMRTMVRLEYRNTTTLEIMMVVIVNKTR